MQPPRDKVFAGPLVGLRVVEMAGLGPVTFTAMLLADMGADVVRITRPAQQEMEHGATLRGRVSMALDLRTDSGHRTALDLLEKADVLLEGFRPGVMERLGLGPTDVTAVRPQLVYGRMTGWGQSGPRAHTAGHDINYIALTGALHAIGSAEPVVPLNLVGDYGGGALYLAMGVLAAVLHARASGQGQVVDAAICDGTISLLSLMHGLHQVGRWKDARQTNTLDGAAPYYRCYRCLDGRFLAVGAIEPAFYALLLQRLGLTNDPLFAQQNDRNQWSAQTQALQQVFATRSRDAWIEHFSGSDACVAPVNSLTESWSDPHLEVRKAFVELAGTRQPAPAPRFSGSPSMARLSESVCDADQVLARWTSEQKT